jgi:hypothetical protein
MMHFRAESKRCSSVNLYLIVGKPNKHDSSSKLPRKPYSTKPFFTGMLSDIQRLIFRGIMYKVIFVG